LLSWAPSHLCYAPHPFAIKVADRSNVKIEVVLLKTMLYTIVWKVGR